TANSDVNTGGCVQLPSATTGADRIVLQHRSVHTLTEVNNVTYEATGLPVVTSEITIKGSGSTIERSSAAPDFRILAVSNLGKLTLKHTTISGGVASGPSGGGGIFNLGTLALEKSTVSGNSASAAGGGVLNRVAGPVAQPGKVRLSHSTVSGNTADGSGGGVANYAFLGGPLEVRLSHSTVSGNTAGGSGGGVANVGARAGSSMLRLTDSTISSNSAGSDGRGVL